LIPFCDEPYSDAVGVGSGVGSEQVETIARVRGADGCRRDTVPFRIPPALRQVPEDFLEGAAGADAEQAGHVLDEQPSSAELARDAPDVGPQPSIIVGAEPSAGDAGGLARESRSDEIHEAAPRAAVEGFQIVPDRRELQGAFDHSISDDGSRVGLPLDNNHKANGGQSKSDAALEAEDASAEGGDGSRFGTNSHTIGLLHG
jgi:hypothetical protein